MRLARDFDYRLFPFDFVDAVRLQDRAVYGVTIPAGTYGLFPNVPDKTMTTLGRRLLLIANKDVPDDAIKALTKTLIESDFAKAYDPPLTVKQFDLLPEFPRHPGVTAFIAEHEPLTHESMSMVLEYIIAAGALACFPPAFFIMRDSMRKRRQTGGRSVREYIVAVSDLEAEAFALDESKAWSHDTVLDVRRRLNRLKLEAMEAYKRDQLDDVDLIDGFLAHVGDLRAHLNALLQTSHPVGNGAATHEPALAVFQSAFAPRSELG
jgi:hypothetical protein